VNLRRGFKAEANELARELRRELSLNLEDPLDPTMLAEHLEIPITTLSAMKDDAPFAAQQFSVKDPTVFSAVTVFYGHQRKIVHNDSHHPVRQASNLAHELSHALLHHRPTPALDEFGNRLWNQTVEDEATWLGGALLISEEAALHIVRNGWSRAQAARYYQVSEEMVIFRLNMTGAQKRLRWGFRARRQRE